MTENELIRDLLRLFPNMTFGKDNSGQLIIYTDKVLRDGNVEDYEVEG